MNEIFSAVFNMSMISSLMIIAVLLIRLVFKKAPKAIICVLWALVGLRLICPFTFESVLSLVPTAKPAKMISDYAFETVVQNSVDKAYEQSSSVSDTSVAALKTMDTFNKIERILPYIWLAGIIILLFISIISILRLKKKISISLKVDSDTRLCDGINTPFILGIFRPKIYIPSHLSEQETELVLKHERAHLKRGDHLWKPLGYLILTVHWFNPLVWLAYALLCRDIEAACDQRVIKNMDTEDKKIYSYTLLNCSAPSHILTACPVAFGEVGVKERVKNVLSFKKPAIWIIIAAVVSCLVVAVVFMTNPKTFTSKNDETIEEFMSRIILEENKNDFTKLYYPCESHTVIATEDVGSQSTYYLWVYYGEYELLDFQVVQAGAGGSYPAAITVFNTDKGFELVEYWEPRDGDYYAGDVRAKFPQECHDLVMLGTSFKDDLSRECKKKAEKHFGVTTLEQNYKDYPRFVAEVLEVYDDILLVAPIEGERIFGDTYDKVYISRNTKVYGEDMHYTKGDIITVSYGEGVEETYPPRLLNIDGISKIQRAYSPAESYNVDFYRSYNYGTDTGVYGLVFADDEKLSNLRVYRYMPERPAEPESFSESGTTYVEEPFAPYIVLDFETKIATFRYGEHTSVTGAFEIMGDELVISGTLTDGFAEVQYASNLVYVFNVANDGYAFDMKASHTLVGSDTDSTINVPSGALFTGGDIHITNNIENIG